MFQAVKSGLLKILSKMGISLLSRYVFCSYFSIPFSKIYISPLLVEAMSTSVSLFLSVAVLIVLTRFFGISYCGAQIFEIYGLGKEVVDLAFCGSVSSIGGLTIDEVRNTQKNKKMSMLLLQRFCFSRY